MVIILKEYFNEFVKILKSQMRAFSFGLNDLFDIIIVAVLLYYVYKFIKNRRAGKLALGLVVILLINVLSNIFSLSALGFIISNFFQIGLLAIVIIFQPELRSALEQAGGTSLKGLKNLGEKHSVENTEKVVNSLCEAACEMAKDKTGALIVFENRMALNDVIASGTVVNAEVSSFLLRNIFFENTPLHDGAVVIRDGRVYAAGCYLPLSEDNSIAKELGTRHRSAIGMSEVSDALVLVVSEETGIISIAENGTIKRNYDYAGLKKELTLFFALDEEVGKKKFNIIPKKTIERVEKHVRKDKKSKTIKDALNDEIELDLFDGDNKE